jgi:hypothetical protein
MEKYINYIFKNEDASYNGVLGGFAILNKPDIEHSELFINTLFEKF